jgi:branched-subunit amino acid transport protein
MTTIVLLGLAAGTFALKAAAPLALGDRTLPDWLTRLADLLPAALLAALVAVSTFASDGALVVDARLAGLAAATTALLLRAPFVVVVVFATAVTALVRLA